MMRNLDVFIITPITLLGAFKDRKASFCFLSSPFCRSQRFSCEQRPFELEPFGEPEVVDLLGPILPWPGERKTEEVSGSSFSNPSFPSPESELCRQSSW